MRERNSNTDTVDLGQIDIPGPAGSLDLDALLVRLARSLASFIGVSGLSLKLVDAAEETVLLKRGDDFKREIVYGSRILAPSGFAAQALSTGMPTLLEDLAGNTTFSLPSYVAREGFKALIAVPLLSATRQIGVLTIYLHEASNVSSQVLGMVSIVGSVTAATVENSELVRRVEKNYFSTVEALTAAIEAKSVKSSLVQS